MSLQVHDQGNVSRGLKLNVWQRWPDWIGFLTALWSGAYGAFGLYWSLGGVGFPFGAGDPGGKGLSLLAGVKQSAFAPWIAAFGLIGAAVALAMSQGKAGKILSKVLLAFAWTAAVILILVVPDYRVLAHLAYAILLRFAQLEWAVVNQLICMLGGILWAVTAVAYNRKIHAACGYCGRSDFPPAWMTPAKAARWGKWAVVVAVAVPMFYALTRWAWALGFPLGLSEEILLEGQATGAWNFGAGLGAVAAGGAILTLGLIRPWGERFPRWMLGVAGKRVPISLAVIPASLVALIVASAGMMFLRLPLLDNDSELLAGGNWAAILPELLWPIWGIALGAAAYAYSLRRRGRCRRCGRE